MNNKYQLGQVVCYLSMGEVVMATVDAIRFSGPGKKPSYHFACNAPFSFQPEDCVYATFAEAMNRLLSMEGGF